MKKMLVNSTVNALNSFVEKTTNTTTCWLVIHQPKEPKCIQNKGK